MTGKLVAVEPQAAKVGRLAAWSPAALLVVLLGHAALYGDWIIDDAGITFAYARNVADGHGFVAYPGEPAVEGFTNLLWLLGLLPWLALGWFDPVWTPKALGVGCAFVALLFVRRAIAVTHPRQRA